MPELTLALSVLIVTTSHGQLGDTGEKTGLWLEELAVPYMTLRDAGVSVTVASTAGGKIPIDPRSLEPEGEHPPAVQRFLEDPAARGALESSERLGDVKWREYDAVFFPGGHGTMWDLPDDPLVGDVVAYFLAADKPVAAVCHGPAALVGARNADGEPVIAGREVSAFTNSEERAVGLMDVVPFALETKLRELGADVKTGEDFQPFALRDGLLITGQNPASSKRVAELLIETLKAAGGSG